MKKTLVIVAMGTCSLLSADQYGGGYGGGSCPGGNCPYNQNQYQGQQPYYQNQPYQGQQPYYQGQQPYHEGQRSYYQQSYNENPSYQRNPNYQPNYNQSPSNQYPPSNPSNAPYDPSGQQYYESNPNRSQHPDYQNQQSYRNLSNDRNYATTEYDQRTDRDDKNPNYNKGYVSDQDISKKIHDAIGSGWFSKGYENVSFEVYNGNVLLKGSVDTLEDKKKVEDEVRKIDGVRQINNQISVNPKKLAYNQIANNASKIKEYEAKFPNDRAASDSDRALNALIRDKLNGGWFSSGYLTIVLNTSNGVVTVSGIVDNYDDIQKITKDIQKIDGVKSVNNRLTSKNK